MTMCFLITFISLTTRTSNIPHHGAPAEIQLTRDAYGVRRTPGKMLQKYASFHVCDTGGHTSLDDFSMNPPAKAGYWAILRHVPLSTSSAPHTKHTVPGTIEATKIRLNGLSIP